MQRGPLPGFRDFYPAEFAERAFIFSTWREVARRYGFVEYDGPPLESLDLYTAKSGDEIVGQLYAFTDKGGREVSLRPEMTPTVARMVAARANALRKPVRWFSLPQLFRYERQQRGRLREHFQLNVDIFGEASVAADAELLAVAIDLMGEFRLTSEDVRARVSDRRLLHALVTAAGVGEEQVPAVFAVIDKVERQTRAATLDRLAEAGLSRAAAEAVLETVGRSDLAAIGRDFASFPDVAQRVDELTRYFGHLENLGVGHWATLDLRIVRGLAYYTGIVFELFDARGEFRAICGGGRYDDLLQGLSGSDLAAVGFGMGDVVLGELLKARALMPAAGSRLDYWVAAADPSLLPTVLSVAARLRRSPWRKSVEYALRPQPLSKQLRAANAAGASRVVILRDERRATVKSMRVEGEQDVDIEGWLRTDGHERAGDHRPPDSAGLTPDSPDPVISAEPNPLSSPNE